MDAAPINPLQRQVQASDLSLERLASSSALSDKQKLPEVCRQFESMLLRQILQESQKTLFKSSFSDDSSVSGIYRDMFTGHLADSISRSGELGFAKSLEVQVSRQALGTKADATSSIEPST